MFHKSESGSELGTIKASMNRTRKTNASTGPKKSTSTKNFINVSWRDISVPHS